MTMLVRDVMTKTPITVRPETTVKEAARVLDAASITAAPVLDEAGTVVGVVSEADLIRDLLPLDPRAHVEPQSMSAVSPSGSVGDVMSAMPVTVDPAEDLRVAVELLTSTTVKSLPVLHQGRLVGVLSRRDVLRVLCRDDSRIEAEINELFRADDTDWLASVRDGVVEVSGPRGSAEITVAGVLAASVPGVVSVRCLDS